MDPEEAVRSLRSYEAEGASGTLEDHAPAVELEDDDVRGVGLVGGVPPRGVSDLEAAIGPTTGIVDDSCLSYYDRLSRRLSTPTGLVGPPRLRA